MMITTWILLALSWAQEPADDLGAVAEGEEIPVESLEIPAPGEVGAKKEADAAVFPWGASLSFTELCWMIGSLGAGIGAGVGAGIAGIAGGIRTRKAMPATIEGWDALTAEVQRIARLQGQVQDQQVADAREMRSAAQELRRQNDLWERILGEQERAP